MSVGTGAANAGASGGSGASAGSTSSAGSGAGTSAGSGQSAGAINPGQGAASGTGTSSQAAGTQNAPVAWDSGLSEDHRGYVQNKGWKAPTDMVDSYRNLEKLVGVPQDQIVRLPKGDDPAAMDAFYNKLGRPGTPDGYKLQTPKEGGNPEFTKWASEAFHKAGLSETQAKGMMDKWNEYIGGQTTAEKTRTEQLRQVEATSLKKEWGAAYDQNMNVAKRAAREFGFDGKTLDALDAAVGHDKTMKLLQKIGAGFGEANFVPGNDGRSSNSFNGAMTPAQAKDQIRQLKSDPDFVRRYTQGGTNSREYAQLQKLHQFAYPDLN